MTPTNNSTAISTTTLNSKLIEIPAGLKMALAMFGVKIEELENLLNDAFASGDIAEMLNNIVTSAATIQRVEDKLDLIINHFKIGETQV